MTSEKKKLIFAVIKKILIIIVFLGIIAGGVYGLMCALGVNTIDKLQEIANNNGFWIYPLITILQVVQVVFIPISNQIISIPALAVIGVVPTFWCSWIGIEIGTIILYLIGRFSGGKLLKWVLGKQETVDKFTHLVTSRKLFYPVGMLIPFLPNDLLTCITGMCKINFIYILIISAITRGICTLFTCVGFGYLIFNPIGIVIMVIGCVLLAILSYVVVRHGDKVEEKIFGFFKKFKKKPLCNCKDCTHISIRKEESSEICYCYRLSKVLNTTTNKCRYFSNRTHSCFNCKNFQEIGTTIDRIRDEEDRKLIDCKYWRDNEEENSNSD